VKTQADNVEKYFFRYLSEKSFDVGDVLPKEVELSENMQISRNIVREGISRLKAIGLVESRKRRGTVICRPRPFLGFEKIINAGLFSEKDRRDYMELRIALELGMCDFIFARRSAEKIAALRRSAGASTTATYDIGSEVDFHTQLMAFAENPAADDFRRILLLALKQEKFHCTATELSPVPHHHICDVLENGDARAFYDIMHKHLETYLRLIPAE